MQEVRQRSVIHGRPRVAALSASLALSVLMFGTSTTANASPSCLSRATIPADGLSRLFAAPLNRSVSIVEADIPLRVALDRVAAISQVRLTYSVDLLPRDRRVCLNLDGISAGVALTELLRGSQLRPLVVDANNVVLTPVRPAAPAEPLPEKLNSVSELASIVVTGTPDEARKRSTAFAFDVIDGAALMRSDAANLSAALNAAVPGMWLWSQGSSSSIGRFGSRGASSFGVTSPKIYFDGIEVANPLLLTQFDPERISRVEVIRGPQGSALYGADAISGVVNIVTRYDGARVGEPSSVVRTRAGYSSSEYSSSGAFVQDHSLGYRAGTGRRTGGLGVSLSTVGDYIPGAATRSLLADGNVRLVGNRTIFTGIGRVSAKDAGGFASPLLSGAASGGSGPINATNNWATGSNSSGPMSGQSVTDTARVVAGSSNSSAMQSQSVRQYTLGTTTTFSQNERWTHTFVAGVDGYRMNGVTTEGMPLPIRTDSLSQASHSESDRTTLSARSVMSLGANNPNASTTITFGAEHAATRQQLEMRDEVRGGELTLSANSLAQNTSVWSNTAGVLAQVNSSIQNRVFLSAGSRVERTTGLVSGSKVSVLPMLGVAYLRERDGQTLKLRASYGKGIRPSNSALRAATLMSGQNAGLLSGNGTQLSLSSLRNLEPEVQAGAEYGADVVFSPKLGVHVTRFDQRATGLIQVVAIPTAARFGNQKPEHSVSYQLQNVGAISNRGWELQTSSIFGRLALHGTASFVDSRVQKVATRYGGELRPGDRMLEVPARTLSLQGTYSTQRWTTSWTVARAMDWVNYDQLRLAEQRAPGFDPSTVTGRGLRDFWRQYDGATRIRGNVSYGLSRGFMLVVAGDNLLNIQRGEPDNITVIPGRTLTLGIRTRF